MSVSWPAIPSNDWNGNTETWMSQLDRNIQLKELSIPGTHDSVSKLGVCHHISTTQYATIEQQLNAGIRFLDLRIKTDGKEGLRMVHGSEDIGNDYPDGESGRLSFRTVLQHIYDWMNTHPKETVIIKVVDCDSDGINTEPDDYDTDDRVYNIWKSIDDASPIKRLQFNEQQTTRSYLQLTLYLAENQLILWRVFKYTQRTIIQGIQKEFGLNLYDLRNRNNDNNPSYSVAAPSSSIAEDPIPALAGQSLYTWKYSSPTHLSYADKINVILPLMYDTWCGHAPGISAQPSDHFCLNELNIAASDGQNIDVSAYYPITNATNINPMISFLLDQILSATTDSPPASSAGVGIQGSVGILLFDWADNPYGPERDYSKTYTYNEPIYKKVIQLNFKTSHIWLKDSIRYKAINDYPYVILQYKKNDSWVDVNTNPLSFA